VISTIKIQHVIVAVLALAFAATAPDTHAQAAVPAVEETVVGSGVKETVATPTLDAAVKMEIRRQNDELRNELRRQYLDDRAESLTWWAKKINLWLAVVAILLTALGIAIPIALASRMKRFRYIETEAREAVKKAQESVDKAREAADKAEKAKDKAFKDSEDIEEKKRKIEEMSTLPERVSDYADALPHIGQSEKFTEEDLEKHIFSVSDKIHRDPKHAAAYNIRGLFKAKLGRHQDAIEDYNESIRLDPKRIHAHYFRGISKASLGRYHAAIEDYDEAIRLNEKHINAHMHRGLAKAGLGRIKGAKGALSDLQIALSLAKESGGDTGVTKISNAIREIEQW